MRVMRPLMLVVLAACGSQSDCPPVEALAGKDPTAQREIRIVVERCASDRWSKQVTDCLRRAATDEMAQQKCFDALTPAQKASLDKAFQPIHDELASSDRTEVLGAFDRDIAALRLDDLVARAPTCGEIKTALQTARDLFAKCKTPSALQAFGIGEHARLKAEVLRAMTDAQQLGTECTTVAKTLTVYGDGCD